MSDLFDSQSIWRPGKTLRIQVEYLKQTNVCHTFTFLYLIFIQFAWSVFTDRVLKMCSLEFSEMNHQVWWELNLEFWAAHQMTSDLSAVLKNINISLLKESEYSNQFPDDRHGTWGQWTSNLLEEWKITFHVDPSLAVCVFSVSWPSDGIIQIILTKLDISEFAGTATRPHHTSSISDNWKYQYPNVTRSAAMLCGIVA